MQDNKCNNWNCVLNEDGEKCVSGNCNNCPYREIREKSE